MFDVDEPVTRVETRLHAIKEVAMTDTETMTKGMVVIFIDQQKFKVQERDYTARELLVLAGENPAETTLVLKHGNELKKFENPDEGVDIKNGMHFVVFHNGPTPVS